jgi:hypothetical protein
MKTTQQHNGANGRGGCGGLPLRERERDKRGERGREEERDGSKQQNQNVESLCCRKEALPHLIHTASRSGPHPKAVCVTRRNSR